MLLNGMNIIPYVCLNNQTVERLFCLFDNVFFLSCHRFQKVFMTSHCTDVRDACANCARIITTFDQMWRQTQLAAGFARGRATGVEILVCGFLFHDIFVQDCGLKMSLPAFIDVAEQEQVGI